MRVLAGYTILHPLHSGNTFAVYRAWRDGDQRAVVIKLAHGDSPSAKALASLRHEYDLLRGLDLPGVVHAYDLLPYGNSLALILEDQGGTSVDLLVRQRPLELLAILRLAIAVAQTLGALHQLPILHKDIKPHKVPIASHRKYRSAAGPSACEAWA